MTHTYTGFTNPLILTAESTYIPSNKTNVVDQTGTQAGDKKVGNSNEKVTS